MNSNQEVLPPTDFIASLDLRIAQLQDAIKTLSSAATKYPSGKLRVGKSHGTDQYFHISGASSKNGIYIPKANSKLPELLAQKEYELKLIVRLKKDIAALKLLRKNFIDQNYYSFYEKFPKGKQKLITPVTLSNEKYIGCWQSELKKAKLGFLPDAPELYSLKGDRVRSKSELLIADALFRNKIPYKYEQPITLKTDRFTKVQVHPDFCCLRAGDRKELFWEHFGMMDDAEYSSKAVNKILTYQRNGIFPGDKLILSFETKTAPLTSRNVDCIIKKWFA